MATKKPKTTKSSFFPNVEASLVFLRFWHETEEKHHRKEIKTKKHRNKTNH